MIKSKQPETNVEEVLGTPKKKNRKKLLIVVSIALLVAACSLLIFKNKSLLVVARVNNSFISRGELVTELVNSYGKTTLEDLVVKKLVLAELKKNNVVVSPSEIDAKIKEIEQSLGDVKLADALEARDMALSDLQNQIMLQLGVEKLLLSTVEVTDTDINTYLSDNASLLQSDTEEGKREEAKNALTSQRLQLAIQTWVTEIRSQAKVVSYL